MTYDKWKIALLTDGTRFDQVSMVNQEEQP